MAKATAAHERRLLVRCLLASLGSLLGGARRLCLSLFLGYVARSLGLVLLSATFFAQAIPVGDDADDLLGLAYDVLDDASDCFFGSTVAHCFPFDRGM